ncbi:TnsD family Tn7-like transposition protein [Ralstonia nicotianae]|uniref:TnsD family Tn7-like transposition protein n=1 Tax=Ralstonia pseudosolanacearum TaxID=1310165 RepID=UPI00336A4152
MPTSCQLDCAVQYAARVASCLESSDRQSEHKKPEVMARLTSSGWADHSGRLRLSALVSAFSAFYSGEFFDARLNALVATSSSVELAVRSLFREDRAVDPVWCVLFRWFAEQCECPVQRKEKGCRKAVCHPSPQRLAELLQSEGSLRAVGQLLGLSVTTVSVACKRCGIEAQWRPKRINVALQAAIKAGLIDGESPADVASRCRVSLSTVYRILAATPHVHSKAERACCARTEEAKAAWRRARESYPSLSGNALRKRIPSVWACLYRNAPEWLRAHSLRGSGRHGARRARTPSSLDASLFKAVCSARAMCARRGTLPVHICWYRLRALTGVSEYALRSRTASWSSPLTGEGRDAFVRRRIAWAEKNAARLPLKTWAMARLANLRVTTVLASTRTGGSRQEEC